MSLIITNQVFTYELTNGTFVVNQTGIKGITVYNNSVVVGSVTGNIYYNGIASSPLTIETDKSITINSSENSVLTGVTVFAPAGCTLQIIILQ